jgi:uncharacterized protein (DUF2126 family)/transglutaminase-like putative cysteine protease
MAIRIALNHQTHYVYDREVDLLPQIIRLRPAGHSRTPITAYSCRVTPAEHFENWQQDPQGNWLLRCVFPKKVCEFKVEIDLAADMTVINPFDFFVESYAEEYPFTYDEALARELRPFLEMVPLQPALEAWLATVDRTKMRTIDFLVGLNQRIQSEIKYLIRLEPGVQSPEETLTLCSGSCRDSAWLLVQALRHVGIAARFVSGYSIQLAPDIKALDGPSGVAQDVCDLHAWAEAYLPGAGWIGLDATSGLMTGEGHIPLAATPDPTSAAPITGSVGEKCETEFHYTMQVTRIHEDPRVTKPYTEDQWTTIEALGHKVDERLNAGDVRLTMGGEPTFVSIDDMDGEEWNTAALGKEKRVRADILMKRLKKQFAPGGLLHYGQGKWYPGESLPRWAFSCYWRRDGQPIWLNPELFADETKQYGFDWPHAEQFARRLTERLGLDANFVIPAYEDAWYYLWRERRLPTNVDPLASKLKDEEERKRLARILERGLSEVVGYVLPLQKVREAEEVGRWATGPWFVRQEHMFLLPGDSAIGLRLPLDSLPWLAAHEVPKLYERDPVEARSEFAPHPAYARQATLPSAPLTQRASELAYASGGNVPSWHEGDDYEYAQATAPRRRQRNGNGNGNGHHDDALNRWWQHESVAPPAHDDSANKIRTALCVEPRDGRLHVFMPPVEFAEDYLDLVAKIEATAAELDRPVVIEGYLPPHDRRLNLVKVTPDPGVIEVNVHPAHNWDEVVKITTTVYEEARQSRLGTEKFQLDGRHTGTGGGNHVVMGGATPTDSPFVRRPDLLRSLVGYWINHPSLSYLFSGMFIGPTSQAPRVDEGRRDALYELQLAFKEIPDSGDCPPWLVDRVFRNLLVDLTGNTHRAEFCIDKLFSPDSATGRLGLVEFRGFEMPPHAQMSLTQQLLLRSLVARFWEAPYKDQLVDWGTTLHDRYLLPYFVKQDFGDVLEDLRAHDLPFDDRWFAPHYEFRFPVIGTFNQRAIEVELRTAIEPWYVLGEEPAGGGTVRFVDSSVERLQVLVRGMTDPRHVVVVNGRRLPLHPTGTAGEYVAGVRYRAWQPSQCLHPTIPVDAPLVFDVLDTWLKKSIGGCTYEVSHPAGRNYTTFPVNSLEAEARRLARFFKMGHTPGPMALPPEENTTAYPLTLDLRR